MCEGEVLGEVEVKKGSSQSHVVQPRLRRGCDRKQRPPSGSSVGSETVNTLAFDDV